MVSHPIFFKLDPELRRRGISDENIEFIHSQIKQHKEDENLLWLDNDFDNLLNSKGLMNIFHEACSAIGINWTHTNNPPQDN